MKEPLIHIGLHKTGTTWLQRQIFSDESLGFKQVRPRTIIDEAFVVCNPFTFDPANAADHFESWHEEAEKNSATLVISHERLSGLPLMSAADARPIADRIHATYPEGRIVIVIREQRSMMLSIYKQYVMRMGKDTFEFVWRDRTIRERRRPGPSREVYEYHYLIEYYQKLFGKDRVLVLPFERLRTDAAGFVGEIMRFIGRPAPTSVTEEQENVALPSAAVAAIRYLNIVFRMIGIGTVFAGPISDRRSRRVRLVVLRALGALLPKRMSTRTDQRWRQAALELAEGRFAESNKRTAELTGLDLSQYGYDL